MHLGKLTIVSVLSIGTALATPISKADVSVSVSPYPQCGYTRFNADDLYMVGVYSSSKCETIWKGQRPGYYRIDRGNCHCQFYETKESCERHDDVPSYSGPELREKPFDGPKPAYVLCAPN